MKHFWSQDDIDFLTEHYAENYNEDLAQALGRSIGAVNAKAHLLGLKKSEAFLREASKVWVNHPNVVANRFKKGMKPHNTGKAHSKEALDKMSRSWFQKGGLPHNTKFDGALSKRGEYWYIRTSLGKWRQLHTYIWEQANRPIERGEMVKFRDGNRDNCAVENLYLCNCAENMKENTIHNYPTEIVQTIKAYHKLKRIIHGKEHDKGRSQPSD